MNRSIVFTLISGLGLFLQANGQGGATADLDNLPRSFEANAGQADSSVKFLSRGSGYRLYLTRQEAVLALRRNRRAAPVRMRLVGGGGRVAAPLGEEPLPGSANYFVGNDPARWHTGVPTYRKVRYRDVYPGVDLIYHGRQGQLEFDLVVAPGGDPKAIRLRLAGAAGVRLAPDGDLVVTAAGGTLTFRKPVIYQEANGGRTPVAGAFTLLARRTIGFRLGSYDRTLPLVIDPVLVYSTYLGGSSADAASAIATDPEGNVYIAGTTASPDFPVTAGAFQTTNNSRTGSGTVFVSKLNPAGTALLYSTYIGGSTLDVAYALAIDGAGNAYIAGATGSSDFPTAGGAFQAASAGASGFVSKLNPTGSALVYSTYFGGIPRALAVDSAGNAYITGGVASTTSFPVTAGAFQTTSKACCGPFLFTPFVSKLNAAGSALVYSTYLSGTGICVFSFGPQQYEGDVANGLTVDSAGNAYITGASYSADFPTTAGAFQAKNNAFHYDNGNICPGAPGSNAFVTKLNPAGTALVYSTCVGGSGRDTANALAVDSAGNAYVAGQTSSADFPVTARAIQAANRSTGGAAFMSKLSAAGSSLVYSTYLGGSGGDAASALAVDPSGNVDITGSTSSADFPVTAGAFQATNRSRARGTVFFTQINPASGPLVYSTYLGGTGSDFGNALALDAAGNAWITGSTSSTDFPVAGKALQTTNRSVSQGSNAFVAKLAVGPPLPAPSITPGRIVPIYSNANTIQAGEWVSIFGTNLASSMAIWNGAFPTLLGGTSVTINGKAAYLIYVSPTQINLQAPSDTATGQVSVVVTTAGGSATSTVTLAPFGPSFCLFDSTHVAGIILRPDRSGSQGGGTYDLLGPTGNSLGYPTVAAKAGDTVELFAVGLGPTNPAVPAGQVFSGAAPTTLSVNLLINQTNVMPLFAGVSSAGLYQINLVVQAGLGTGDVSLVAGVGALQTPTGVVISLQ